MKSYEYIMTWSIIMIDSVVEYIKNNMDMFNVLFKIHESVDRKIRYFEEKDFAMIPLYVPFDLVFVSGKFNINDGRFIRIVITKYLPYEDGVQQTLIESRKVIPLIYDGASDKYILDFLHIGEQL